MADDTQQTANPQDPNSSASGGSGPGMPPPPPPGAGQPPMGGAQGAQGAGGYDPAQYGYGPPPPGYGYPPAGYPPPPPGYPYPPAQGYGYPPQQGGAAAGQYGYGPPPPGYGYPPAGYPPPPPMEEQVTTPIGSFGRDEKTFKTTIKIPAHSLTFDENKFLRLLAGSISLTKDEKRRIIEAVPRLSQYQIDELIKILDEEKNKFSALDVKHKEQLNSLQKKHADDWGDLELEMAAPEKQQAEDDQAKKLRESLGLQQGQDGASKAEDKKKK